MRALLCAEFYGVGSASAEVRGHGTVSSMRTAPLPTWGQACLPAGVGVVCQGPPPSPLQKSLLLGAVLTTGVAGTGLEEGPLEGLGLPLRPRTRSPSACPSAMVSRAHASHLAHSPSPDQVLCTPSCMGGRRPCAPDVVPKVARSLWHCCCSAPHLSRSGGFIIPSVRTGLGGCVGGPGEPGPDRATCVMQRAL